MRELLRHRQRIARYSLNSALQHEDIELASFFHHANSVGVERGLIEFAARVCYASTVKLGTAPNFVVNVLRSGHLSVAEHPNFAIHMFEIFGTIGRNSINYSKLQLLYRNRYFDFNLRYIIGNLRSWIEFTKTKFVSPALMAPLIAIIPDAFDTDEYLPYHALEIDSFRSYIHVPTYNEGGVKISMLGANVDIPKISTEVGTQGRYTWLVEGVSRGLTHQVARHRGASISQESQRYVDATKRVQFVYPPEANTAQRAQLEDFYSASMARYEVLRKSGMKKEDARFVLPNGIATRLVLSFNYAELLHFLRVRCAKDAQWEIRRMANVMLDQTLLANESIELREIKKWTES